MLFLGVNVDHIATLRQARRGSEPDPVAAAVLVELAGADGIVAHLREDRRHMQDRDIRLLRRTLSTRLNLEMAGTAEMTAIALEVRPNLVTLVPERREELTTEGGLDVIKHRTSLRKTVAAFQNGGIPVSLFIDPDPDQILAAKETGADILEIHTGRYAEVRNSDEASREWEIIRDSARQARDLGFRVSAGHGLTYRNVPRIVAIPEIEELNIGHSIISRAALVGLERA
ncbi:MAG: pyridoxine 5'-phosphate synthase, partial [Nitrospirae bacterium]|nr:pyridoxine 5'-phosphate synthase [Nitrospirota bacterium]